MALILGDSGVVREFLFDVGAGRLSWARRVLASGVNPDIDTTSVPEDVWYAGGLCPFPLNTASLEAVSSSTNDAAAGTGLRTMIVQGLGATYNEISETVTLNGTTPVALANSYLRINAAAITSAGSSGVNAGTITIREAGAGQTRAAMRPGYGIARQAHYTVPAGYTLMIESVTLTLLRQTGTGFTATGAAFFGSPTGFYRMTQELSVAAGPFLNTIVVPAPVPEKWDFSIRCTGVSDNNTELGANVLGVLIENSRL